MKNSFITIATCRFEAQAESIRLLLRQEGIHAFVVDANAVTVNWFWGPALGFIKVQVPRSQEAEALDVLRRHPRSPVDAAEAADDAPAKCLACGESMPEDADSCPRCGWTFKLGESQDEPGVFVGAQPYEYTVPYEPDIQAALDKLRRQVFDSKEFNGSEFDPPTPEAAIEVAAEEGTRSILDISRVSDEPESCCAAPLTPGELQAYFGTDKPTVEALQQSEEFWEGLERGQARYVILYEGSQPKGIYFVGYSFD